MRIACLGGGPASLYFSILMKKAFPKVEIQVYERNRADDTFGWGVVFSEETLGHFREADAESYDEITAAFARWDDIDTYVGDACVTSTGHGFCGLARKSLLEILHRRARDLGVGLHFETEIESDRVLGDRDLVVAADGVNSRVREAHAAAFRPTIAWGRCRFTWLGTTKPLKAFTFVFRENEHGLFVVHAYPFQADRSTWIVECHEDVWRRAGLDAATEEDTVRYVAALFEDHLEGHALLVNRSIWRSFPTISCEAWHTGKVVLLGDAAHTAHFSVGSGTKLAMEDAIALVDAFAHHGLGDVPSVLTSYQEARWLDVLKVQKAAATSQTWFENASRYLDQHPLPFTFNLMTRSKRITYDNLRVRDPELIDRVTEHYARMNDVPPASDDSVPPPVFAPFQVRGVELPNRIVVSPMCQYRAEDGLVGDWHLVHLGSRALGGAGLVLTEMTDVLPEGRITRGCAGLWSDAHEEAWRRIVTFVHANSGSRIGIQLAHAGRKASCSRPWEGDRPLRDATAWEAIAPSALPFDAGWPAPREMTRADMEAVRDAFAAATRRAEAAGFDVVELHMAHGYLLSSFLSPVCNRRRDAYGGDLEGRLRFPLEVLDAVRAVWPDEKPLFVRISASDWLEGDEGLTPDDAVAIAAALAAHGCDVVDVSSGGNTPASKPVYGRMYQVPFAEKIRYEAKVPVMAVGAIQGADHANTILAAGRADLCAMARPHLVDPYLTLRAAVEYGHPDVAWPASYLAARPASFPRRRDPNA